MENKIVEEQNEENLYNEALDLYAFERYQSAIDKINYILENFLKTNYKHKYLLFKTICLMGIKDYDLALNNLDLLENDTSYAKSFNYLYIRSKLLFAMEKYLETKMCLNLAIKQISANDKQQLMQLTPLLNKVDLELSVGGVLDLNKIIQQGDLKIMYSWIQTSTDVTVECTSNISLENYEIKLEKRQISFINKSDNKPGKIIYLTNAILPEKSSFKLLGNNMKCRCDLIKEVPNFNWINLETNPNITDPKTDTSDKITYGYYPSSSKVKKDWAQVDKELEAETKEEIKYGGNDGMWNLFRQVYAQGDENCRRAMIKSFQTSGGTVLSTNWNDVKDKDYEGKDRPEAPSGQEWAKPDK